MHLVIGTGQARSLDFTIVSGRDTIPAGARVYAIFSGDYASDQLDEYLFDTMTDEEYYTFRALAQDARALEALGRQAQTAAPAESLVGRLRRWLLGGQPAAGSAERAQSVVRGVRASTARAGGRSA